MTWFVYLLECLDGSFYTGITTNVSKRMKAHKTGNGSKYVKHRGFKKLLFFKECVNRSDASKCEIRVKRLSRNGKVKWFSC